MSSSFSRSSQQRRIQSHEVRAGDCSTRNGELRQLMPDVRVMNACKSATNHKKVTAASCTACTAQSAPLFTLLHGSPYRFAHITSSQLPPSFSPSITPSTFHSRLKTRSHNPFLHFHSYSFRTHFTDLNLY